MTLHPAGPSSARQLCEHCDAPSAAIYLLPPARRRGERQTIGVCRLCYIQLVGIRPRRAALVTPAEPLAAP